MTKKQIKEIEFVVTPINGNEVFIDGVPQGYFGTPIIMADCDQHKGHYKFVRVE